MQRRYTKEKWAICSMISFQYQLEGYVDDIMAKSRTLTYHSGNLATIFESMAKYNLKLNSQRYMFGVIIVKLLKFLISVRGIDVNPNKVNSIVEIS